MPNDYDVDTDELPSMDEYDTGRRNEQIESNERSQPDYSSLGLRQDFQHNLYVPQKATSSQGVVELDLSNRQLSNIPSQYLLIDSSLSKGTYSASRVRTLDLHHNDIEEIEDDEIALFSMLHTLNMADNRLTHVSSAVCALEQLTVLSLSNNRLTTASFTKFFAGLQRLQVLNIGGNQIETFPPVLLELTKLRALYMGANRLQELPANISQMRGLQQLYLGGNRLRDIPPTIGQLSKLTSLTLCDNRLENIPSSIAQLQLLESLMLHNNRLTTLPPQIVKLRNLHQLSLRSNPLVAQFVHDLVLQPPTLTELAGRIVRQEKIPYARLNRVPRSVEEYLNSANECVNPKCKGVYFTSRVEHVKFVDFCGKYRVPLLEYLCSSSCTQHRNDNTTTTASSEYETDEPSTSRATTSQHRRRMRKVLLG